MLNRYFRRLQPDMEVVGGIDVVPEIGALVRVKILCRAQLDEAFGKESRNEERRLEYSVNDAWKSGVGDNVGARKREHERHQGYGNYRIVTALELWIGPYHRILIGLLSKGERSLPQWQLGKQDQRFRICA